MVSKFGQNCEKLSGDWPHRDVIDDTTATLAEPSALAKKVEDAVGADSDRTFHVLPGLDRDVDWHRIVAVHLAPHRYLSAEQARMVREEYMGGLQQRFLTSEPLSPSI